MLGGGQQWLSQAAAVAWLKLGKATGTERMRHVANPAARAAMSVGLPRSGNANFKGRSEKQTARAQQESRQNTMYISASVGVQHCTAQHSTSIAAHFRG